jgi:hypothetical protein
MQILGRSILLTALAWFLLSLYAVFWPSTSATVFETGNISLSQNGYNGVQKYGTQNFSGTTVNFKIASYRYVVSEVIYEGKGKINLQSGDTLKIYYCPVYPSFSLTQNTIPLPWILLLCILGFGVLEIRKWLVSLPK